MRADGLTPAEDLDDDPNIVEVDLVAKEGTWSFGGGGESTQVWSYNGTLPGPFIEADVGDTLIVHFQNDLTVPTTVHWHGMDVPAAMDGSHIAQHPVAPGKTFEYAFPLLRPGLYWFHPHVRSFEQVEKGMYGLILVRDPDVESTLDLPKQELVLALDDILLDDDGRVAEPWPADPLERAEMQVNGREGNTLLVNGRVAPSFDVRAGEPVRLRLLNAANARFMRVSIPGHTMYRIGGDGGLAAHPVEVAPVTDADGGHDSGGHEGGHDSGGDDSGGHDSGGHATGGHATGGHDSGGHGVPTSGILLTPGERADVVVTPNGCPGDTLALEWHDFARGRHQAMYEDDGTIALMHAHDDGAQPKQRLATLHITESENAPHDAVHCTSTPWTPPSHLASIEPIDATGAEPIKLTIGHGQPDENGDVTGFIQMVDGVGVPFDDITAELMPTVQVGETRVWEVTNMAHGAHNFHPHGFAFQVLEWVPIDGGEPLVPDVLEYKDTVIIPARMTLRAVVRFDDDGREGQLGASGRFPSDGQSGGWLAHCHILEHAARGMGTAFAIEPASTTAK